MPTEEQIQQAHMDLAEALTDTSRACDRLRKRLETVIMRFENPNLQHAAKAQSIERLRTAIADTEGLNRSVRRMIS